MLIVEYCQFGNLQTYLVKNRSHFVDQLNQEEDRFDANITVQKSGIRADNGYVSFHR